MSDDKQTEQPGVPTNRHISINPLGGFRPATQRCNYCGQPIDESERACGYCGSVN